MAKATEIKDILAVQEQLTQTRGEIEQLTAQRDYLKNQAAMSTLSVAFVLPSKTVTTQATNEWDFNKQVDEAVAGAGAHRPGHGHRSPSGPSSSACRCSAGLLILWILYRIGRRITPPLRRAPCSPSLLRHITGRARSTGPACSSARRLASVSPGWPSGAR